MSKTYKFLPKIKSIVAVYLIHTVPTIVDVDVLKPISFTYNRLAIPKSISLIHVLAMSIILELLISLSFVVIYY